LAIWGSNVNAIDERRLSVNRYNRNKEKVKALEIAGAMTASSPAELIQQTEVILIMVSNDRQSEKFLRVTLALLNAKTTGKVIINMSTVSPGISKEMASLCKEQHSHYLDAPVSGSVKQAEGGNWLSWWW